MRGAIGTWNYYVTLLPFKEVARRIKRTEEIHSSALLRKMIQRALTPRSKNIADYLKSHSVIRFVGNSELLRTFISPARDARIGKPASFDVSGYEISTYVVDKGHEAVIAPLKASELVRLDGIANQALIEFAKPVDFPRCLEPVAPPPRLAFAAA